MASPTQIAFNAIGSLGSDLGKAFGRMSVEVNGRRVALTPDAVRKAQAKREASNAAGK